MSTPQAEVQEFISSLAGRWEELQDGYTVSGAGSIRFNTYVYMRKLLIRKSMEDDLAHHQIYCTHCLRSPWRVSARFTTTSTQLQHLHKHHPWLPTI